MIAVCALRTVRNSVCHSSGCVSKQCVPQCVLQQCVCCEAVTSRRHIVSGGRLRSGGVVFILHLSGQQWQLTDLVQLHSGVKGAFDCCQGCREHLLFQE